MDQRLYIKHGQKKRSFNNVQLVEKALSYIKVVMIHLL